MEGGSRCLANQGVSERLNRTSSVAEVSGSDQRCHFTV